MGLVLMLLLFGVWVAGTYWAAWWMLEPINREAGRLALSTRFMLSDGLALMVLLQFPLAAAGRAIETSGSPEGNQTAYWLLLLISCGLMVVLWGAGVSVVSRAGITRLWPRMAVIVLLVPGALVVIAAWPLGLYFSIEWSQALGSVRMLVLGVLALGVSAGVMFGIRRLAFWSLGMRAVRTAASREAGASR